MGVFLRKSFGAGPVRFNISKSGIGVSAGVKGLRTSVGPRGIGISGGRRGVYFRKTLTDGSGRSASSASSEGVASRPVEPAQATPKEKRDAYQAKKAQSPLSPGGGYPLAITLTVFAAFWLFFALISLPMVLNGASNAGAPIFLVLVAAFWFALAAVAFRKKSEKIKQFKRHEAALSKLTHVEDKALLNELRASFVGLHKATWEGRHRFIYTGIFEAALEDGIDAYEFAWLKELSKVLWVNAPSIHEAMIKERLWETMADRSVTETEEADIEELLEICGIGSDALKAERFALKQFIAARPVQEGNLPTIEVQTNLQRNEVCHHQTTGSILEKRVLRRYTVDGEKQKDEGLVVTKEGTIFVTSKRVLIVGEGTSSIPHDKILDLEIDPDDNVISITKDGRQKPLFLRVDDLIYTGILLEAISTTPSREA